MNFMEIAQARQSCRSYDETKPVEEEKLSAILEAARLSPSACNGQPYHITVLRGEAAKEAALACRGLGAKVKNNDYRSIDIGIACAYLTAEATAQGLSTCILGWFDDPKIRELCGISEPARLVITLGYAAQDDHLRQKKRKELSELVSYKE